MHLLLLLLSSCGLNPCDFDKYACYNPDEHWPYKKPEPKKEELPPAWDSTSPEYVVPQEDDDGILNCDTHDDPANKDCYIPPKKTENDIKYYGLGIY